MGLWCWLKIVQNSYWKPLRKESRKQSPLRTAKEGPLEGPFFSFLGGFFLGEDLVEEVHSETLLSSTTLHAQSSKLAQMCLRKCSDPNPGTQACLNCKRLLLQQVHGPSATPISVCQNFSRGCHAESFAERIGNCAQNDTGEFHLTGIRIHCPRCPWTLPSACPVTLPYRGPLRGKIRFEAVQRKHIIYAEMVLAELLTDPMNGRTSGCTNGCANGCAWVRASSGWGLPRQNGFDRAPPVGEQKWLFRMLWCYITPEQSLVKACVWVVQAAIKQPFLEIFGVRNVKKCEFECEFECG